MNTFHPTSIALALAAILMSAGSVVAQCEVSGWGNLRGIRVAGQLVPFTTAVGAFDPNFRRATLSQREGPTHTNRYARQGDTVEVDATLDLRPRRAATQPTTRGAPPVGTLQYSVRYTDSAPGVCDVSVDVTSTTDQAIGGVFYFLTLPAAVFADGSVRSTDASTQPATDEGGQFSNVRGIRITGKNNALVELSLPEPLDISLQHQQGRDNRESQDNRRDNGDVRVYFPIYQGALKAGQKVSSHFTLKASVDIDTAPATVTLDSSTTGRIWEGIGGNYRIQNARVDPLHIQFILDNMRVAYGRVALPWNTWQPDEDTPSPYLAGAPTTQLSRRGRGGPMNAVQPAIDIAQKLAALKIPLIISAWFPPDWAVLPATGNRPNGGRRLDPAKYDKICKSLASYLLYLKGHNVEPEYFSFNESNVGINVLQNANEHDLAIKTLGAYFKSVGLKTKFLLGDTGDAAPIDFIKVALNDPDAAPYIGAVSFHSWRGATDAQYQAWADAATKLGVPLFDAEGGNDAQAAQYSTIFGEDWYAQDEAAEYARIMRICQPKSILEWQLTENYSVLSTDASGLHPTRRFFNLKQFNLAQAGSLWSAVRSDSDLVLPAAFIDPSGKTCTIHLVNNGATRAVTINGLPTAISTMSAYVTDKTRGMKKLDAVPVNSGVAKMTLPENSFLTLTNQ